jgi:hypothetical protein
MQFDIPSGSRAQKTMFQKKKLFVQDLFPRLHLAKDQGESQRQNLDQGCLMWKN